MIAQNLKQILDTIPNGVELAAVSKFQPIEALKEAYNCGQRIFAENRPLELKQKFDELPKDIKWHFIGHLQTNKIKYIIKFVDLIHSIDSIRLLEAVNDAAMKCNRNVDVLLEVFIAQEETKQGFSADEIVDLFSSKALQKFQNIKVKGLMAMASLTNNETQISSEFATVKRLFDDLNTNHNANLTTLSMGMSSDYMIAISHGANLVRVGSSIFGQRH